MYVYRNTEARSRNHCCSGKAGIISYWPVCACLCVRACRYPSAWARACAYVHTALLIQHAKRMRHIRPSVSTTCFDIISNAAKEVTEHKMCVFIISITFV